MKCKVCSNLFNKTNFAPRVLKCGHTVCDSCVVSKDVDGIFEVSCGICNETTRYRSPAINRPLNLALMDIIEQESEASTEKCQIHGRELTKFCKRCKAATCDLCSKKEHSSKLGCEECSLKEGLTLSLNEEKVLHLTHIEQAYIEKKRRLTEIKETLDQSITYIRNDRTFLEHCLEDTDSFLEQLQSLIKGNEFTSIAEYNKRQKEIEQIAKFDANVDTICNFGCHPFSSVFKNAKILNIAMKDKLEASELAYLSFRGDEFRRIIYKDGAFRVNLDKTETVFSPSELPMNSLKFKAESWPSYTFVIKFGGGEEIRLDMDLRNIESEQLQPFFNMMTDGKSSQKAEFYMGLFSLYFGPEDLRFNVEMFELPHTDNPHTKIEKKKYAIIAYNYDPSKCVYNAYQFLKCGIDHIVKQVGVTLIGYHEMNNKDIIPEKSYTNWSTELEIF